MKVILPLRGNRRDLFSKSCRFFHDCDFNVIDCENEQQWTAWIKMTNSTLLYYDAEKLHVRTPKIVEDKSYK